MTNSIAEEYISTTDYYISTNERHQLDASGRCVLIHNPHVQGNYKVVAYNLESDVELDSKAVSVVSGNLIEVTGGANLIVSITYYYNYDGDIKELILKNESFNGTFHLEGKTTIVEDNGEKRSVFVVFPKISLVGGMLTKATLGLPVG